MTEEEILHFVDTVSASTLANKAMLACMLANKPVTIENCLVAAGPWLNPDSEHFERLAVALQGHVRSALEAGERLSPSSEWN